MKLSRWLALTAVVAVVAGGTLAVSQANAKEEDKSVIATGFDNPRGIKLGPDGMLYVAEAGKGGDIDVGDAGFSGLSGRVTMVDPETGDKTVLADDLPSNVLEPEIGDAVGPADVAFIGSKLYYLQTHGGDAYGFPDTPTGIYEVKDDGTTELVADIGEFNMDNVPPSIDDGSQEDVEVGGNPYAMVVKNNAFYVSDANHNRLMKVTTSGDIEIVAQFDNHPVPTGLTFRASGGPFYVAALGTFPFSDDDGNVYSATTSGQTTEIADGIGSLMDVEIGPGDNLYAVAFATQNPAAEPAPWNFMTGSVGKVNSDGSITRVVDGLSFPGSIIFDGDTAYITNNSLSALAPGEILRIENFSQQTVAEPTAVVPPTTAPVATPTTAGGITAPDTGTGGTGGTGGGTPMAMLLGVLAVAALGTGGALALRRR